MDVSILQHALIGYQAERAKFDQKIAEIEARLKGLRVPSVTTVSTPTGRPKRRFSPAALQRIKEGQRKRWAEFRKQKAAKATAKKAVAKKRPAKKVTAKKPVSPEVMQKRLAALEKARAVRAAKRVQGAG